MKKLAILFLGLFVLTGSARADFQAGMDNYEKEDYATALKEWRPLAEAGFPDSQRMLGYMHGNGKGVVENHKEALKWYRKAAEQGYAIGQGSLGYVYLKGEGVTQDFVHAYMWFNIAAQNGDEKAKTRKNNLEKEMMPSQLEESKNLTRECVRKDYKGC